MDTCSFQSYTQVFHKFATETNIITGINSSQHTGFHDIHCKSMVLIKNYPRCEIFHLSSSTGDIHS